MVLDDVERSNLLADTGSLEARLTILASRYDVAGMAKFIGVDSLAFLSIDGLYRAMGLPGRDPRNPGFCDACFTGDYPIELDDVNGTDDRQLSLLVEPA